MDRLGKKPKNHFQMDFNTFQHFKGDHIRIGAKMNYLGGTYYGSMGYSYQHWRYRRIRLHGLQYFRRSMKLDSHEIGWGIPLESHGLQFSGGMKSLWKQELPMDSHRNHHDIPINSPEKHQPMNSPFIHPFARWNHHEIIGQMINTPSKSLSQGFPIVSYNFSDKIIIKITRFEEVKHNIFLRFPHSFSIVFPWVFLL